VNSSKVMSTKIFTEEEVIIIPKMLKLNERYCKGCYLCIYVCPKKVFDLSDKPNLYGVYSPKIVRREDCIDYKNMLEDKRSLCSLCVVTCPDQALWWEEVP